MPTNEAPTERGRREGARFRDDTKLAVVGRLGELADRLRAEWEDPVLLAKLRVLDDETLDDERRERLMREMAEAAQVDQVTVLRWVEANLRGELL